MAGEEEAGDGRQPPLPGADGGRVTAVPGRDDEDENAGGEQVAPRRDGEGGGVRLTDQRPRRRDGDDGDGEQPEISPVHVLTVRAVRTAEGGRRVTTIEVDRWDQHAARAARGHGRRRYRADDTGRGAGHVQAARRRPTGRPRRWPPSPTPRSPAYPYGSTGPLGAEPGDALATLAWFHGGGFVIGDLDTADPTARKLANRSGCLVVSVDYRLAPENPFPAAPDDCWAVTTALAGGEAAAHGGDPGRLAVGGDSAGGNLAAVDRHPRPRRRPRPPPPAPRVPGHRPAAVVPVDGRERRGLPAHQGRDAVVPRQLPRARRRPRTRWRRRCSPPISPAWRRRTCSRPGSTRCATRATPTPPRSPPPASTSSTTGTRR